MNRYSKYLPFLEKALMSLDEWRSSFGTISNEKIKPAETEKLEYIFDQFLEKLSDNYPFHHPSYAGQMLKPPHPAAWAAYSLAMTINPNNHALDGGPPTSAMEQEVMAKLAKMVEYKQPILGHLTSGGTIANLEALWIAREIHPEKAIASTANAHYTHRRMCNVLNTKHITVPVDEAGVPDMDFLKTFADEIGTLVVTMGTTGMGTVEPLNVLMPWAEAHHIRIHLDAAYGGFYKLAAGEEGIEKEPWELTARADSIVIDPHKHGLQPYGCGSVLFRNPDIGRYYSHDSPYTYFTSEDLHLGEITLECSRSGTSAAALWLTLQLLPLNRQGLGDVLITCRRAARRFAALIHESFDFNLYFKPDLDIVCYYPIPDKKNTINVSALSQNILKKLMTKSTKPLFLSILKVPSDHFVRLHPGYKKDSEETVILRSVLMKPEHEQFVDELLNRLEQ